MINTLSDLSMRYQSEEDDKATLSKSQGAGHNDTGTGRRDVSRATGQKLIISPLGDAAQLC